METVCPEVVPCIGEWPDEDGLKFTIERQELILYSVAYEK
jgi:hypothetical protein